MAVTFSRRIYETPRARHAPLTLVSPSIPVAPFLVRLLKMTASCVLASLNASTYWKVRLGISLATALLDSHFEQPAGMKQALPFLSSFFQMLMIPHRSRGCQSAYLFDQVHSRSFLIRSGFVGCKGKDQLLVEPSYRPADIC